MMRRSGRAWSAPSRIVASTPTGWRVTTMPCRARETPLGSVSCRHSRRSNRPDHSITGHQVRPRQCGIRDDRPADISSRRGCRETSRASRWPNAMGGRPRSRRNGPRQLCLSTRPCRLRTAIRVCVVGGVDRASRGRRCSRRLRLHRCRPAVGRSRRLDLESQHDRRNCRPGPIFRRWVSGTTMTGCACSAMRSTPSACGVRKWFPAQETARGLDGR